VTTKLEAALARAKEWLANATPEEREAMWKAQRESWVRGEMAMGDSSVVHNPSIEDDGFITVIGLSKS
jgi:hypothetical protein